MGIIIDQVYENRMHDQTKIKEEKMNVNPIPEGFHNVTPYLMVQGATKLIDFLKQAFGAQERFRMKNPDGTIMHAEIRIGDSIIMLADATGEHKVMPSCIFLYVEDTDSTYQKAVKAGAVSKMEPADQFWGDRSANIVDPCGNAWWIATHIKDVSMEEMEEASKKMR